MLLAVGGPVVLEPGETPFVETVVRYRTVGDMSCTGAVRSTRHDVERGDRRGRRQPASPSAARPAPTTRSANPPWKTASERATSDDRTPHSTSPSTAPTLRIATAGSVDDGKSTLIGRLLHDTKTRVRGSARPRSRKASRRYGDGESNLALLTDGLRAEREQGITIDVAYRYFATPDRSFIVADTPGHAQYTRNMVTGASTADVAIVLVDARHGVRRADPPPRVHRRRCSACTPSSSGRQQDGPRRLGRGRVRPPSPRSSPATSTRLPTPVPVVAVPISRAARRQRRRPVDRTPLVRRPAAARAASRRSTWRPTRRRRRRPAARAAGDPAAGRRARRLPRATPACSPAAARGRRRRRRAAGRDDATVGRHRRLRPELDTPVPGQSIAVRLVEHGRRRPWRRARRQLAGDGPAARRPRRSRPTSAG